jgi:hypothetical protein
MLFPVDTQTDLPVQNDTEPRYGEAFLYFLDPQLAQAWQSASPETGSEQAAADPDTTADPAGTKPPGINPVCGMPNAPMLSWYPGGCSGP